MKKVLGEYLGTTLLVAIVVGSGIMATNLSQDVGVQLLINTISTVFGLAGIGDMSLTCSGPHSRNMAYGINFVKNKSNKHKLDLVEGLNAIDSAIFLAQSLNIEMPIVNAINDILTKKANINEVIKNLLTRPITNEFL